MEKLIYLLLATGFLSGFFAGLLLAAKPRLAIELQKIFYAKINWRMEPISMEKEIRNTRIMGIFLIIVTVIGTVIALLRWEKIV